MTRDELIDAVAREIDPLVWGHDGDYPAERSRIAARRFQSQSAATRVLAALDKEGLAVLSKQRLADRFDEILIGCAEQGCAVTGEELSIAVSVAFVAGRIDREPEDG